MNEAKIIYLLRKVLTAAACALAAVLHPAAAHQLCPKELQGAVHQLRRRLG